MEVGGNFRKILLDIPEFASLETFLSGLFESAMIVRPLESALEDLPPPLTMACNFSIRLSLAAI
jgi:hypothetical protein